jgi:hypothetical protein
MIPLVPLYPKMLDLDFKIIQRMIGTLSPIWFDRWDDYLDEYFTDWSMEYFDIHAHEMIYIKEYVFDKGFIFKRQKNAINKYIYLRAEEYLLNDPEIQKELLSLGCKVPIQRNDKE